MKIFFIASIHGKQKFIDHYQKIVDIVEAKDHKITADHVLNSTKMEMAKWDHDQDLAFHKKVLRGIKSHDVVLAEISYPSLSVGYLLALAVESGKPAIALYNTEKKPHLLRTLEADDKFYSYQYRDYVDLQDELPLLIKFAGEQQDTRFNFFISPRHQNYLDWIAKNKKIPRSVFLRRLIEEHMEENEEYM